MRRRTRIRLGAEMQLHMPLSFSWFSVKRKCIAMNSHFPLTSAGHSKSFGDNPFPLGSQGRVEILDCWKTGRFFSSSLKNPSGSTVQRWKFMPFPTVILRYGGCILNNSEQLSILCLPNYDNASPTQIFQFNFTWKKSKSKHPLFFPIRWVIRQFYLLTTVTVIVCEQE